MKFNLRINQKAIIQEGFEIDLIEAVILDFIIEYVNSGSVVSISDAGTTFYWISHSKVSEELPILKMEKNTIYKRIKKLCEKGFLIQSEKSQILGRSFYAISEKANKIKFIDMDKNIGSKSEGVDERPKVAEINPKPMEINPTASDENPNDNNNSNNINQNNNLFPKGNLKKSTRKTKTSKPKKTESDGIYKPAVGIYFDFYERLNGLKPKFDSADGKALKTIINYFKGIHKDKSPELDQKKFVLDALIYVFENWDEQIDFIRNQTKLTQINSNLNNIINRLRNEKKSNQKRTNYGNKISGKSRPFTVEDFT